MPWIVLLSEAKNSLGAYDASVATLTVPALFSSEDSFATAAELVPPAFTVWLPPEDEPPQPARTTARAAQAPRIAVRDIGRVDTGTSSDHFVLDTSCQQPGKGPVQALCQNFGAWLPSTTIRTAPSLLCTAAGRSRSSARSPSVTVPICPWPTPRASPRSAWR